MEQKEIAENNKLIAQFMELKRFWDGRYGWMYPNPLEGGSSIFGDAGLKYHLSWDWLMQVVEKIETLKSPSSETIRVIIGDNKSCVITSGTLATDGEVEILYCLDKSFDKSSSKIKATYRAVVEFIKWHDKKAVAVTPNEVQK